MTKSTPRLARNAAARPRGDKLRQAASKARAVDAPRKQYSYPVTAPQLLPGVVPEGEQAAVAMDSASYSYANSSGFGGGGFPGYPYLSQLATRAEYRAFASALSTELTREWIELTCTDDDGSKAEKLQLIEEELKRLDVRGAIKAVAEHDAYFGRGQLALDIAGADPATPLILDKRAIAKGTLKRVAPIEPAWTTPAGYNAGDPMAPDFYRPNAWHVMGKAVHASRLLTVITRPVPDMLKPAFNFGGISLSQLAEPYVDNWLRTRQSVADLINNFSLTILSTSMDQVLQGDDDGTDLFARADLFTAGRSNRGLMIVDKEREEVGQVNTPLSGLHELQAQSQEHMCSVSRTPAIVLTGISPSGLNASSDGEIRIYYDWISAQQEAHYRTPVETILKAIQLSLFGEIDPSIGFTFVPLYQMTPKEEAEIREADGRTDCAYVTAGILAPEEVRQRLADDPASGHQGLDVAAEIVPPALEPDSEVDPAMDAEQPRAPDGTFGTGRTRAHVVGEIDAIGQTARERMEEAHKNKGVGVAISGAEVDHLSSEERGLLHDLQQELKTYDQDDLDAAKARIAAKIAARKNAPKP